MRLMLLAAAGGAIGAALRYLVNINMTAWLGATFPWATLTVNVVGSFAMGALAAVLLHHVAVPWGPEVRIFLATGILGGFTTFSAFSLDAVALVERRQLMLAAAYVAGSVVLSIAALVAGMTLARGIGR